MITRIISGGQTGADRGGLDAAIELGIPHGGWCPKGRRAEDGIIPERYQLQEHSSSRYPPRTRKNIQDADWTMVFVGSELTRGSELTVHLASELRKPVTVIRLNGDDPLKQFQAHLRSVASRCMLRTMNVAGSRESKVPGIQLAVKELLVEALGPV